VDSPNPEEPKSEASETAGNFKHSHSLHDLERRTISSGIVRAAAQGAQFVLTFGYNVVMARLLTPHQYGLVTMVMTVVGMLQIFREMGLSTATIQRADISHAQVSNLFWLNVSVSGGASLLMALGSPVIAWYFKEPSLVNIALALSSSFLLSGLSAQHVALLHREMRFSAISAIEVGSLAVGSAVGIALALVGIGYWALVTATLVQAVLRISLVWMLCSWRPQRPVRGVGTLPLIHFGVNLTAGGFFYSFARSCEGLFIGRAYGAFSVGLYSRAAALLLRPLDQFTTPIYSVTVPALSRLQGHAERYRKFFLLLFESLAIAGFFLTGLVLPLAHPLTVAVLGEKWHAAAPIFAGLSFAGIFVPLSSAAGLLYTTQGRGRDLAVLSLVEAGVVIAAILLGLSFGPTGVAIAMSIAGLGVNLPLTFFLAGRTGPVNSGDLFAACSRHLPIFAAVLGGSFGAHELTDGFAPVVQLFVCGSVGVGAGVAGLFAFTPSRQTTMRIYNALLTWRSSDTK